MARGEMLTVFAYDVSDNRRRRRVARILEGGMSRVQGSVFEARLSRHAAASLAQRAAAELGPGDGLRVYAVGAQAEARCGSYGDGAPIEPDGDYWIV